MSPARRLLLGGAIGAIAAAALVAVQSGRAAHPTGPVDAASARRAGVHADVTAVSCFDCHAAHGGSEHAMLAPDATRDGCVECHPAQGRASAAYHPLDARVTDPSALRALRDGGHVLGPRDTTTCTACHAIHADHDAGQTCATCHGDQSAELHAEVGGHGGLACVECHAPHVGVGQSHLAAASAGDPAGCRSCHAPGRSAAEPGVDPGVLGHPVGVTDADGDAITCASCHGDHRPGANPAREGTGTDADCASCHEDQHQALARGGHGDATCADCHPVHSVGPMQTASAGRFDLNPRSIACLACHAEGSSWEAPKVASFDHPPQVFDPAGQRWEPVGSLPLFDADGNEMPPGRNGALTCDSCHVTHGPEVGTQESATGLRRSGWREACASCHGEDALSLYLYFHQPDRQPQTRPER